jgi:hypothetical protein
MQNVKNTTLNIACIKKYKDGNKGKDIHSKVEADKVYGSRFI